MTLFTNSALKGHRKGKVLKAGQGSNNNKKES